MRSYTLTFVDIFDRNFLNVSRAMRVLSRCVVTQLRCVAFLQLYPRCLPPLPLGSLQLTAPRVRDLITAEARSGELWLFRRRFKQLFNSFRCLHIVVQLAL